MNGKYSPYFSPWVKASIDGIPKVVLFGEDH